MFGIELVEPSVQLTHPGPALELLGYCTLGESRHVQARPARVLVEVVRQADVPASHTHTLPITRPNP